MTTWSEVEQTLAGLKRLATRTVDATFRDAHQHLGRMMDYIGDTPILKECVDGCRLEFPEEQVVENLNRFLKTRGRIPLALGKNSEGEIAFLYRAFKLLRNNLGAILQIGHILSNENNGMVMVATFGKKMVMPFYDDIFDIFTRNRNRFADEKAAEKGTGQSPKRYAYDVFVSHADADKDAFVNSLVEALEKLDVSIWYDAKSADWGDSLKATINKGLETCRFGIVVISPKFLGRKWTEMELSELLQRQNESGEKVVLPLLYNLTVGQMKDQYPSLEDFKARIVKPDEDPRDIVIDFARVLLKSLRATQ